MVVTVVAFLMQTSWLYFVAFALLVGAVLVLIQYVIERNRKRPVVRPVPIKPVRKPADELRSHGILEVRPKRKSDDQRLFTNNPEFRKPARVQRDAYPSPRRKAREKVAEPVEPECGMSTMATMR